MSLEERSLSVERLDTAAKVQTNAARLISRVRVALLCLTPFFIFLAAVSTAPGRETLLVSIVAAAALITTVVLWVKWRYQVYVLAALCLTIAASGVLSQDHPRHTTAIGWIGSNPLTVMFLYWAGALLVIARRYAVVNGNDWREERGQLSAWINVGGGGTCPEVVEFSSGSFWTGYWTYRVYNPGTCWLIARFKKGTTKMVECRVRDLAHVVFHRASSGKWNIDITANGKRKSFIEVQLSGKIPPAFVR